MSFMSFQQARDIRDVQDEYEPTPLEAAKERIADLETKIAAAEARTLRGEHPCWGCSDVVKYGSEACRSCYKHTEALEWEGGRAALDAALEQRVVEVLGLLERAIDGYEGEYPSLDTDTGEAFANVLAAHNAALRKARLGNRLLEPMECGHPLAAWELDDDGPHCAWCRTLRKARAENQEAINRHRDQAYEHGKQVGRASGAAEERERCQLIICSFTELDITWKTVLCAAIMNPDWPTEDGREHYEKLQRWRTEDNNEQVDGGAASRIHSRTHDRGTDRVAAMGAVEVKSQEPEGQTMSGIDRVAIFERAESMTLNSEHVVALATVALHSLDRNRQLISFCPECGGQKRYDEGQWVFDHEPDCPWETIGGIERLEIEADDGQTKEAAA